MDEFGNVDSDGSLDTFCDSAGMDDFSVGEIPDMPADDYDFVEVQEPVENFEQAEDSFEAEEFPDMPDDDYGLDGTEEAAEDFELVGETPDLVAEFPDMPEEDVEVTEESVEPLAEDEEAVEAVSDDVEIPMSEEIADFDGMEEGPQGDTATVEEIEDSVSDGTAEELDLESDFVSGGFEEAADLAGDQMDASEESGEIFGQDGFLDEPAQREALEVQESEEQDEASSLEEEANIEGTDEDAPDTGEINVEEGTSAEGVEAPAEGGYSSLSEYMNAHNYGADDFPEYSKDPEWQRLHELEYPEAPSGELPDLSSVDESSDQLEFDAVEQTGTISQNSPEISPEVGGVSPETIGEYAPSIPVNTEAWDSLSEVSFAGNPEPVADVDGQPETNWDDLGDVPFAGDAESVTGAGELGYEMTEVSDEIGETGSLTPSQALENMDAYMAEHGYGASDYLEYSQDPEWQSLNNDLIAADAGIESIQADEGVGQAGSESIFLGRVYNEFEQSVLEQNPEFYETGKFYEQGVNEFGYQGTCGPTSQANALNQLMDTNVYTENNILSLAKDNGLCDVVEGCPEASGGTTTEQFMDLYEKVSEQSGGAFRAECFDYDNALNAEEVANKLDQGAVVNVAVDSKTLWGERPEGFDPLNVGQTAEASDHWITVSGVRRDASGDISGFDIIDSGGGENYVSLDKYNDMCFGASEHKVLDPTCIVVEKTAGAGTSFKRADSFDANAKYSKRISRLEEIRREKEELAELRRELLQAQSDFDVLETDGDNGVLPGDVFDGINETDDSGTDEHPRSDPQLNLDYGSTTRKR